MRQHSNEYCPINIIFSLTVQKPHTQLALIFSIVMSSATPLPVQIFTIDLLIQWLSQNVTRSLSTHSMKRHYFDLFVLSIAFHHVLSYHLQYQGGSQYKKIAVQNKITAHFDMCGVLLKIQCTHSWLVRTKMGSLDVCKCILYVCKYIFQQIYL